MKYPSFLSLFLNNLEQMLLGESGSWGWGLGFSLTEDFVRDKEGISTERLIVVVAWLGH